MTQSVLAPPVPIESARRLKQLNEINSYLLPLATFKTPRKIGDWGTATLLNVGNCHFAVTAAHVLEGFDETQRLVLPPNISSEKGPRSIFRTVPKAGNDEVDLGVFRFFESEVENLNELGWKFYGTDDVIWDHQWEEGSTYLFNGYPATGAKVSGTVTPFGMTADIAAISPSEMKELGFDSHLHILGRFDIKNMINEEGIRSTPKKPNGMSGGSVLVKQLEEKNLKLVGIGIEYHRDKKVLAGTKAHQIATLLAHGYPEIHRYLPKWA